MGLSSSLYIGPYVECKWSSTIDIYKLADDFHDRLMTLVDDNLVVWQKQNNTHIWISNRKLICQNYPEIQIDCLQSSIQEIPIGLPAAQIDTFKEQFRTELTKLTEVYGEYNMVYKWGIINQIY